MSAVSDLDPLLKSLEALKPPGASKSKIAAITQLCIENVQSDSLVAQKLFTHFKKTPTTHKLGVLYVVDSITRQWVDRARQNGQELSGSSAPNGTYASGVHRMTEIMPSLIDDMIKFAPQDQKDKVENLVKIWERSNTFPPKFIAEFHAKLKGLPSATPPGSPPAAVLQSLGLQQRAVGQQAQQPPPSDAASVLKALASLGGPQKQQPQQLQQHSGPQSYQQPLPVSAPQAYQQPPPPYTAPKQDLTALLSTLGQPPASAPPQQFAHFQPPPPPQQHAPAPRPAGMFNGAAPPPPQANPLAALTALMPPHILGNPEQLAKVLQLFQQLTQANIPQDQWAPVIAALFPGGNQQAQPPAPAPVPSWQPSPAQNDFGGRDGRYESYGGGRRDRSRSPDYRRERGTGVNRRPSPVYGVYDASVKERNDLGSDADGRGRRQDTRDYRQRSPPGVRGSGAMPPSNMPKWTDVDHTLPPRHIKVLSRTLFVGGANGSEAELRAIFGRFGQVQTCIVNNDKRHAFVKMCTRADAVNAREGMENMRDPEVLAKARQTKWGVGFGPRDCCNYANGVSIIPIDNLTEADNKWVLTAEFGGTGGRPVESGLVFEEPDIEIGAGVSSKAMSRRVMPDTGGAGGGGGGGGGKRGRGGRDGGGGGRFRQPEPRYESPRPEPANVQPPPPVPNFGFQFAMPGQGMPYQ